MKCSLHLTLGIGFALIFGIAGCQQPNTEESETVTPSISTTASTPSSAEIESSLKAIKIVFKADGSGSFDPVAVPNAGGLSLKASRIFDINGNLISNSSIPPWFSEARVFLTSTRTSGGGNPVVPSGSDTPCSYFDSFPGDNNVDTSGYYTIDGYNAANVVSDIDQCAGTDVSELNKLYLYVKLDRLFLGSNEKIQVIVNAKPINAPNTTADPSSCSSGGNFTPEACTNQLFTISMRTAPGAPTGFKPLLFPSAKALDLQSEIITMPINISSSINTISIDRIKGGAIFYSLTLVRI